MIFFPTIYEDELLYSVIARYHIKSGNLTYRETLKDVFGDKNISPSIYLQSNILNIIDNSPLNCKYDEKDLVYNSTLYLYYTAFMDQIFSDKVYESMLNSYNTHVCAECGIIARGTRNNKYLKFCPMCINEDIERYGEAYWHKTHQIPENLICTKHKVLLQDSSVEINRYNKYELIEANLENCKIKENKVMYSKKTMEALYRLSNNIDIILKNILPNRDNIWFKENYKNYLKVLNYSSMNGIINQSKASEDFLNYYGKEFLDLLDLNVGTNKKNWLKKLLSYTEHNNSTVKHLLVIDFLGIDLNELFNQIYLYEPFGEGPWPCLNKNEKHYEQNIVNDLKLEYDYKTKCIVGIFTCSCGYKYRLRYKKTLISDRELLKKLNDLIREKDFQTIIKRLNQGLSIYDKDLDKIELVLGRKKISRNYREKMNGLKEETRKRHHEIWLNLRKQYPQKSKNELVELSISTASWLYKFDKEWFEENSPEKKQSTNYKKTRIDWNKKDEELYYTAKKVIEELYKEDKNLNRVTKSRVLKMCGVKYYSSEMLKKLPKTKKFIDDNIEEVQEFRIRKIKWKIADLFKKEEEITLTKLLSGMTANKSEKEELKLIIENELKKYRI